MSKINHLEAVNRFYSEHLEENLHKLENDVRIKSIMVLPGAKNKRTGLGEGIFVNRCDDVIITASELSPELFEYQTGCGFLLAKLSCNNEIDLAAFAENIENSLFELSVSPYSIKDKIVKKLGFSAERKSKRKFSIQDEDLLELLINGADSYSAISKKTKNKLFDFSNSNTTYIGGGKISNIENINYIKKNFLSEKKNKPHDEGLFGVFGSHYIDLLVAKDCEKKSNYEYYINIHGCSSNFPSLLSNEYIEQLQENTLPKETIRDLVLLLQNQGQLNRLSLLGSFIELLHSTLALTKEDLIECYTVKDQTHHDIVEKEECVNYYNDCQRLGEGMSAIIPSGIPNGINYVVKNNSTNEVGVPHNFKRIYKNSVSEKLEHECMNVNVVEAPIVSLNRINASYNVEVIKENIISSPVVNEVLTNFYYEHNISIAHELIPMMRYRCKGRK